MKAAVFRGSDRLLAIEELPLPQAGAGELVLRVHYCGVCGSDLHATHPGLFTVKEGTVLGHEFAGAGLGQRQLLDGQQAVAAAEDGGFHGAEVPKREGMAAVWWRGPQSSCVQPLTCSRWAQDEAALPA